MDKQHKISLGQAVEVIRNNGTLRQIDLTALLALDSRADRYEINSTLAQAYLEQGQLELAAVYADRAWLLSGGDLDFLPTYLEIHNARDDVERVRAAHKKAGMRFAASDNLTEALKHFNLHHYAYQSARKGDHYEFDFDILNAIESLAKPYRAAIAPPQPSTEADQKIRVAYLVFGAAHNESVLIKLLCYFAEHHDPDRFTVSFFVPEGFDATPPYVLPYLQTNLQKLTEAGADIQMPGGKDAFSGLLELAGQMAEFRPDILVTTAALADYAHFFLACTRPAPLRIGLVYGPPEQYAPPGFDWVITATRHPLIDSPCDGTLVPAEVDLPDPAAIKPFSLTDFKIPSEATLVVIVGRPEKFLSREYWQALSDILVSCKDAWMLIVGINGIPDGHAKNIAPPVLPRIQFAGYRSDYERVLAMADIVLDTFPSGGGATVLDTMALGIPMATFRNDYSRKFDQTQWSPAEELFDVTELIVPRGDFGRFTALVIELIANPALRREMGERCRESVTRLNGRPGRMVRRCEEVYQAVLSARRDLSSKPARTVGIARLPPPKIALRPPLWRRALNRLRRKIRALLKAE